MILLHLSARVLFVKPYSIMDVKLLEQCYDMYHVFSAQDLVTR